MSRRVLAGVLLALALVAVFAVVLPRLLHPGEAPAGQNAITKLGPDNFGQLRASFNAARGKTRIIAMLSPT